MFDRMAGAAFDTGGTAIGLPREIFIFANHTFLSELISGFLPDLYDFLVIIIQDLFKESRRTGLQTWFLSAFTAPVRIDPYIIGSARIFETVI